MVKVYEMSYGRKVYIRRFASMERAQAWGKSLPSRTFIYE